MPQNDYRAFADFPEIHAGNELVWSDRLQMGYYPVANDRTPYDKAYYDKYDVYSQTQLGAQLNDFRYALVNRYFPFISNRPLIDIGIGSGSFIDYCQLKGCTTLGYDVNPVCIEWLRKRYHFCDPYAESVDAVSCWDSLEHIRRPQDLIQNVRKYIFVSIPIFQDKAHVLRSKHFRKDEHFWYFTRAGLTRAMKWYEFDLKFSTNKETSLGREDIESFVFKRAGL